MREILFRGKRIDNGEWVYGSLSMEYFAECGCIMISPTSDTCYKVIPSTVGQYTGLTDKNGTKIFEGDIIEADNGIRPPAVAVVKFGENYPTMFYQMLDRLRPGTKHLPAISFYAETIDKHQHLILIQSPCVEAIGNIHDNPELLEVSDNV